MVIYDCYQSLNCEHQGHCLWLVSPPMCIELLWHHQRSPKAWNAGSTMHLSHPDTGMWCLFQRPITDTHYQSSGPGINIHSSDKKCSSCHPELELHLMHAQTSLCLPPHE